MNLREDKHWSYGAFALFLQARGPRPFIAYAPVQTDKTKESVAEILKELREVKTDRPLTPDEVAFAQNTLTLTLPGQWETADAVAGSIGQIVRFGFPDDYFDGYATRVRRVSVADTVEAAKVIHPARLAWVIAGDRAKIEAGLEQLGLGEVHEIDADGNLVP